MESQISLLWSQNFSCSPLLSFFFFHYQAFCFILGFYISFLTLPPFSGLCENISTVVFSVCSEPLMHIENVVQKIEKVLTQFQQLFSKYGPQTSLSSLETFQGVPQGKSIFIRKTFFAFFTILTFALRLQEQLKLLALTLIKTKAPNRTSSCGILQYHSPPVKISK